MYYLESFSLRDMTDLSACLRKLGNGAPSVEQVAEKTVAHLFDQIRSKDSGEPACALVRLFKTHRFGDLQPELRAFARTQLGTNGASDDMKCLVLLGTAGVKPEWNCTRESAGHRAIPLPSPEFVKAFPMISHLISQFGIELHELIAPEPSLILDAAQTSFNVFYVAEALGSPNVPAQEDFVLPYGIRSVLGFGGMLPGQDLFAVILFSREPIPYTVAEMFKPLALSVKVALLSAGGSSLLASNK
ncbi:MAG TPA: hypothetical protein V6D08_01810 [Candidatus Obscuribacterales bacterium]